MKSFLFAVAIALSLCACARGPNVSTDQLPLRRVVIYRNGVGYFERSGHVDAEQVTFKMRARMVGDFLATLAIVEHGGSSVRSASFPLEVEDEDETEPPPDPRYQSMLKPWPIPEPKKKDKDMRKVVLRLDGNEHDLAVGYVAQTPLWRPSYRVVVQKNGEADLQTWGIVQNLSGEDWEDVQLALVAGAPLAFESTLGDPVIPDRPIITDTGEVIASVPGSETSLSEESAAPAAPPPADRDEEDRKAVEAEPAAEVAQEGAAGGVPGGAVGGRGHAEKKGRAVARLDNVRSGAAPAPSSTPAKPKTKAMTSTERHRAAIEQSKREGLSAPRNLSALAAVAIEAATTRYELPNAVTIPNESATMVLLLNRRVPGEAVYLFAPDGGVPDSASHPFRVARFTNRTRGLLERGPIAVFEHGSFLGQGMLDPLPPNATATVPFALERSLAVTTDHRYEEQGARLGKIEAGELYIERDTVMKTLYKVKNGSDQNAKLLVKHPRNAGTRLFKPPLGTEDNVGTGTALVPVTIAPHGTRELLVDERRAELRVTDWLSPLADEAVEAYLSDNRRDLALAQKLNDAWSVRRALKAVVDERTKLQTEQGELEKSANDTRASLKAIEKNTQAADLRQTLTRRLAEISMRFEQITKRMVEVGMNINELEVRFRDKIRDIRLLTPLPPKD